MPGRHNRENAAAATAAARAAGIEDDAIAEALRTFPGVPHRLELVRERNGVRWVNDSKATNTAAARRGVAAYDAPLRLILGGRARARTSAPFARELPPNVASIYLVGEASDELAAALDAAGRAYVAHGRSRVPSSSRRARRSPATSSSSRRPARATTSSRTSSNAARTFRRLVDGARPEEVAEKAALSGTS